MTYDYISNKKQFAIITSLLLYLYKVSKPLWFPAKPPA
jgi:hypothetical protein